MLKPANRLKDKQLFNKILKIGRYQSGQFTVIKFLPQADKLLIGFIVSTKVSKKAVVRNKIKRRLREIFRLLIKDKKIKTGFEIVVIAKPKAAEAGFKELEKEINNLMMKSNIKCDS